MSGRQRARAVPANGKAPSRRRPKDRLGLMLVLLIAALVIVGIRLVHIQVIAAPAYAEKAKAQRTRDIELAPRRGAILDREGEPLGVSREARTIYASPRMVEEATATAEALAGVLGGDVADYTERLGRDSGFVYIARKVDMERAEAVDNLKLTGIGQLKDSRRTYPGGELASQVLGFVGVDDSGLGGLESYYDELLAGTPGSVLAERDPYGRPMPGGVMDTEDPVHGSDIVISIDRDIQYIAQVELQEAVEKWSAASGSIVVMEPNTGEILAMASVPSFNPNRFGEASDAAKRNRAICDVYEPGSTLKSITAAAVIDAGLYEAGDTFVLPPTLTVGSRTIKEAHPRGQVEWSLTEIVGNSSNVGTVMLGQALGERPLHDYLTGFGFTTPTGIDFPGEAAGYMPPVDQWSATSIANIPFGQGISMSPLQLARAIAVIANGGELVSPHFLVDVPDQADVEITYPKTRVISQESAAATREILKAAITDGTGSAAAVQGYEVAGKTGTAQKARTDGRGYAGGKYVGSFVGFLPADDPGVLVLVVIDEPKGAIYGGVVAAPVFSEVARFAVSHLRIPPTTAPPETDGSHVETVTAGQEP
jgi:cell division protein FtsI (penicillin-binding protein 3)